MSDRVRRFVDVVVGLLLLVVTSPLLLGAAVAVRVVLGRPVLFRQTRLGRDGVPFDLLKFRTMRPLPDGPWTPEHDAERTPRLGALLRSTSIDELPSLVNLLRGDIGLVGPRPLPVDYVGRFHDEEMVRFTVRPGLTGLAQVNGRNAVDWDTRLALDARYVADRSLLGDLRILVATVPAVLGRRGIDSAPGVTMGALPIDRVERAGDGPATPSP